MGTSSLHRMAPPITPAGLLKLRRLVVLASRSPRRAELLRLLGIPFIIHPAQLAEPDDGTGMTPSEYVLSLAQRKAQAVARHARQPSFVLGADTTVVLEGTYLNKPTSADAARRMLHQLSGRTHEVYTGVVVICVPEMTVLSGVARTEVTFRSLSDEEIEAYVTSGSPLDKAGAYGIQDPFGAVFVESIRGCYYNVVGLPLGLVYQLLRQASYAPE